MQLHPTIFRIAIFLLTLLCFARLIQCNFSWWDDQDTIRENPRLNPPTWDTLEFYWNINQAGEHSTMGLYVPATYTVWSGLAKIAHRDSPDAEGLFLNPWVFHGANILIHACTAVVVFQLLLRLFGNDLAAAAGALLFALHPVQVESVAWISGTKDLLCGLFSAGALLMYVRSIDTRSDDPHHRWPSRWRFLLGTLFFILGVLSKPTAVVVPPLAAVIGLFLLPSRSLRYPEEPDSSQIDPALRRTSETGLGKIALSLLPWFVLIIPCVIWTKIVQPATWVSPLPLWARPAVAADAIAFYLCKLVWPMHLCVDYGHNPRAIVDNHLIFYSWILPALAIALFWSNRKTWRVPVASALMFLVPLFPVLGFVGFEFQQLSTTSDHYLYLPMLGAALLACYLLTRMQSPRKYGAAIAMLLALGAKTLLQEPVWQDTRSLFLHNLAVNPQSTSSCDTLGYVTGRDARRLVAAGHPDDARKLFDESIAWYQRTLSMSPMSVPTMYNLALDYQAVGERERGLQQMHRIAQVQPLLPPGLRVDPIDLAHRLYDFPDIPGAIAWLEEVLRRDPGNTQAAVLHQKAIEHLQNGSK